MIKTLADATAQLGFSPRTDTLHGYRYFRCPSCCTGKVLIWNDGISGICTNHDHCEVGVWNNFRLLRAAGPANAKQDEALRRHLDMSPVELEKEIQQLRLNELIHRAQQATVISCVRMAETLKLEGGVESWRKDVLLLNELSIPALMDIVPKDYHRELRSHRAALVMRGTPYYVGGLVLLQSLQNPGLVRIPFHTHRWQQTGLTRPDALLQFQRIQAYTPELAPPRQGNLRVALFDAEATRPGFPRVGRILRAPYQYQHMWLALGLWQYGNETIWDPIRDRLISVEDELRTILQRAGHDEAISWLRRAKQTQPEKAGAFMNSLPLAEQLRFKDELSYEVLYSEGNMVLERTSSGMFVKKRTGREGAMSLSNFVWLPVESLYCEESRRVIHAGTLHINGVTINSQLDDSALNTPAVLEDALKMQVLRVDKQAMSLPVIHERKQLHVWADYIRLHAREHPRKSGCDFLGWSADRKFYVAPGWVVDTDNAIQPRPYRPVDGAAFTQYTELPLPEEIEVTAAHLNALVLELLGAVVLTYHTKQAAGFWRPVAQEEQLRELAKAWGQTSFVPKLTVPELHVLRGYPCLSVSQPVYADLPAGIISVSPQVSGGLIPEDVLDPKVLNWLLASTAMLCLEDWVTPAESCLQAGIDVCEKLGIEGVLARSGFGVLARLNTMPIILTMEPTRRVIVLTPKELNEEVSAYLASLKDELLRYCGSCTLTPQFTLEVPDLSFMSLYRSVLGPDINLALPNLD